MGRDLKFKESEVDEVLSPTEHLTFLRRLNVLSFKLQRAQVSPRIAGMVVAWW